MKRILLAISLGLGIAFQLFTANDASAACAATSASMKDNASSTFAMGLANDPNGNCSNYFTPLQGAALLSNTNGWWTNLLQNNAVLSITNPIWVAGAQAESVTMQNGATANGNGTSLTVTGYQTALVNVNCSVACSGGTTINFEGTDSTGTFFLIGCVPVVGTSAMVSTATTSGQFYCPVPALTTIRARISAYSAGTITVTGTPMFGASTSIAQVANAVASVANNADGVAASSSLANSPVASYNYAFNGTTWDRLQDDSGKNAKVVLGGGTPISASATGTTAATTATLAGTSGKTTFICGLSIRANATAAATGNATVTGTITGTLNFTQWTAPNASGVGVTEETFTPCLAASGTNQGIAVVSAAPGTGGVVSSTAWGYQQ